MRFAAVLLVLPALSACVPANLDVAMSGGGTGGTGEDMGLGTSGATVDHGGGGGNDGLDGTSDAADATDGMGVGDAGEGSDAGEEADAGETGTDGDGTDGDGTDGDGTDDADTGGETDGGETDGGETDGGETDGGETDGDDGGDADGGLDLAGPPACDSPGAWIVETITISSANDVDIAVGASGTPQVAWVGDMGAGGYAHRGADATWLVDESLNIGGELVALAADPSGVGVAAELPFIINFTTNWLAGLWSRRLAADGTWTPAQLDLDAVYSNIGGPDGGGLDVAFGDDGTVHAVWSPHTGQLAYGRLDAGDEASVDNWNEELIDATFSIAARGASIAVEGPTLHVAYGGGSDLRYARRDGLGAFMLETVDDQHEAEEPAIAVDALGRPAISYHDESANTLRYAHRDGAWAHELVDGGVATLGVRSGLGIAADGTVDIAYWDFTGLDVESARRAAPEAGAWSLQTVDFLDVVGAWLSAQMDTEGGLHVVYVKAAPNPSEIRYAYRCPG